jgi:succinate dehydrogenase hydrophobic anchor subunit
METRRRKRTKKAAYKEGGVEHLQSNQTFDDLPKEILNEIAKFLLVDSNGRTNIHALSQVNSKCYEICSQDAYWSHQPKFSVDSCTNYHKYNYSTRIRRILSGTVKEQLFNVRNAQINAALLANKKQRYESLVHKLAKPWLDKILLLCLLIGHLLWVTQYVTEKYPINSFLILVPLSIVCILFCFVAALALVSAWAVELAARYSVTASWDNLSYLFCVAKNTLTYSRYYNGYRWAGTQKFLGNFQICEKVNFLLLEQLFQFFLFSFQCFCITFKLLAQCMLRCQQVH